MTAAPEALPPRQQAIVDLLSQGPRPMRELMAACGYEPGDRRGQLYVSQQLLRLSRRGYSFHNVRPPGSHRGGLYMLTRRPRVRPAERFCIDCSRPLRASNEGSRCGPCEVTYRRLVELPWPRLLTLPLTEAGRKVGA